MSLPTLMALPLEIRLNIWKHVIPQEVEVNMVDRTTRNSKFGPRVGSLPLSPMIPLKLICRKANIEISTLPKPILCATAEKTNLSAALGLATAEFRRSIKRIKETGMMVPFYYAGDRFSSNQALKEKRLLSDASQYFGAVKIIYSKFGKPEFGQAYDEEYEVHLEVKEPLR